MVVWNKGLTKETDERVMNYGLKGSMTISSSPNELEKRSIRMSAGRLSGVIPTLYGQEHPQWNGGVSTLQGTCRSALSRVWNFPKMKKAKFACECCGVTGQGVVLNVHHSGERFAAIVRKFSIKHVWAGDVSDIEKKNAISREVVDYHIENDVPGVCVCHECHVMLHSEKGEHIG